MAKPSEVLTPEAMDKVLQMIESGMRQLEIAQEFHVSKPSLNAYLNSDAYADRSARARLESAEAWLDKGLQAIKDAMDKSSGLDATAARAYAQECARRAAIRNPRYNERLSVDLTAKVTTNAQLTEAELMEIAARGKTPGGVVQKG